MLLICGLSKQLLVLLISAQILGHPLDMDNLGVTASQKKSFLIEEYVLLFILYYV